MRKTKTPTKTPTLAQLRKLAKRKGQYLVFYPYSIRVCEGGTWWINAVFGPLNLLSGGTIVRNQAEVRGCILAVLSALPDKERAK